MCIAIASDTLFSIFNVLPQNTRCPFTPFECRRSMLSKSRIHAMQSDLDDCTEEKLGRKAFAYFSITLIAHTRMASGVIHTSHRLACKRRDRIPLKRVPEQQHITSSERRLRISKTSPQQPDPQISHPGPNPLQGEVVFQFLVAVKNTGAIPRPRNQCATVTPFAKAIATWAALCGQSRIWNWRLSPSPLTTSFRPRAVHWRKKGVFDTMLRTSTVQGLEVHVRCKQAGA